MLNQQQIAYFQEAVWDYYARHARHMPWRLPEPDGRFDPYKIMVSEIMLQQTQVSRVEPKFEEFLQRFPDVTVLAQASLSEVLQSWNGLGYNRRAKFLYQAAWQIVDQHNSVVPRTLNMLTNLPGIGVHTAGAILTYAFNQPVAFLETNIRTVYIHHFFAEQPNPVADAQLLPLVIATGSTDQPRVWGWALMDYGAHLKATIGNLSRHSQHYTKQSRFQGSRRQLRAQVLKALLTRPHTPGQLADDFSDARLPEVLAALQQERFIVLQAGEYKLV